MFNRSAKVQDGQRRKQVSRTSIVLIKCRYIDACTMKKIVIATAFPRRNVQSTTSLFLYVKRSPCHALWTISLHVRGDSRNEASNSSLTQPWCRRLSSRPSNVAMPIPQGILVPSEFGEDAETSLYPCGKRGEQVIIAASSPSYSLRSRVPFIHKCNSGKRFMVNSGADASAISPADRQRLIDGFTFKAVNRTSIKTYGLSSI